ncbi:MAG: hypothetical protein RSG96_01855 [Clostridia bacterium]
MKQQITREQEKDMQVLDALCSHFREELRLRHEEECEREAVTAMLRFPHAPQPHNLMGVLMELRDNHLLAMRHFRAAWALDPTYRPARYNMECMSTFFAAAMPFAITEVDCVAPKA